jgi:hypothetical protein
LIVPIPSAGKSSSVVARGIGKRDGEAFSDRPKTGVSDVPGFDPPVSFDARQSQNAPFEDAAV